MKNGKVRLGVLLKFLIDNDYIRETADGLLLPTGKTDKLYEEYKKNPEGALMQMGLEF